MLKATLLSFVTGHFIYNKPISHIFEAQEELKKSKECPLAVIKEETIYNNHDGTHQGNWDKMTFKFDNKNKTTQMYLDGDYQAMWSRILNNDETCSLSINYIQIFT